MAGDIVARLRGRALDLRTKFVDGRGYSFKRDYPGWFNAFAEVLTLAGEALDQVVDLRAALAEREAAYRDLAAEHEARMAESDATIAQLRAEWDKTDAALVATVQRVEELRGASKKLRRDITGDIEWTATQFREFMNHAQELCDIVDRIYAATGAGEGQP